MRISFRLSYASQVVVWDFLHFGAIMKYIQGTNFHMSLGFQGHRWFWRHLDPKNIPKVKASFISGGMTGRLGPIYLGSWVVFHPLPQTTSCIPQMVVIFPIYHRFPIYL